MNEWINNYEIAAIVIMIAVSVLYFAGQRVYTKTSRVFYTMLLTGLASAIIDELSIYGLSHPDIVSRSANNFLNVAYFVTMLAAVFLYALYVLFVTGSEYRYSQRDLTIFTLPIVIEFFLIITSPFTHIMFYIDEAGIYHRGPGMTQSFVVMGLYVLFMAYQTIARSDHLTLVELLSILMYNASIIGSIILQVIFPKVLLTSFAMAVGMLLVFTSMQGDFVDSDKLLGTFSSDAWSKKIEQAFENNRKLTLLIVRLGGYEKISTQVGYEGCNDVLRQIAEFLMKLIPGHQVYHLSGLYFGCVLNADADAVGYAKAIEDRLSQNFMIEGYMGNIKVPFYISIVNCPEHASSAHELDFLINMVCGEPSEYDNDRIHVVTDDDKAKFDRRRAIEVALEHAVRTGDFAVQYQPIISMEDMKVFALEALVRLKDEKLGRIYPDEFIPLAEKIGSITQTTECVLNRAASLMAKYDLKSKGIHRMHVNLTASECRRGDADGRLASIVKSYDLEPYTINLEISESAYSGDMNPVGEGIVKLHESGMGIVLDDFGTGYSNMTEIVALPIDLVKIDRSFLWTAMMDDAAMTVLREFIDMIHKSGRKVLVTGVEDERGLSVVKELEADLVQGYCFSMPVDQDDLFDYISNVNQYDMSPIQKFR